MSEGTEGTEGTEPVSPVNSDGTFVENWHEKYGEDSKPTLSRFKGIDDLVNTHMEQRRKFGKNPDALVEIPNDDSSDGVRAAWAKAHNVPEAYEYKLSDEMAVKLGPLDDKNMATMQEFAKKKNWSQADYKDALDLYHTIQSTGVDSANLSFDETRTAAIEAGKAELKKEWLDGYDDRVIRAQAVMRKYGGDEAVAEFAAENSPTMIRFLDNIAESMSEDTLKGLGGSGGATRDSIKARIADNRSKMNAIMKANPANYRGDVKFRELDKSNIELYKQMP